MHYLVYGTMIITLAQIKRAEIHDPDWSYDQERLDPMWNPQDEGEREKNYTFRLNYPGDTFIEIYRGTFYQCIHFQEAYIFLLNNGKRAVRIEDIVEMMNTPTIRVSAGDRLK